MKTTVPNKEKETNSSNKSTTVIMSPNSSAASASTGGTKDQMKATLEKDLEDVNNKLNSISLSKDKKSGEFENEVKYLEKKCLLLLKLKNWEEVMEEGYKILGKKGPNVTIYKCILVSLCRLEKIEDDVSELLNHWKKATPKCSQMLETKRKMDGYLTAIRSGVSANEILQNLEDVIGLNSLSLLTSNSASETNWKFRSPPQRHNTFSLCSRMESSGSSCIYGNDCISAHSKEELKEWQTRVQWKISKHDGDLSPVFNIVNNNSGNLVVSQGIPKERIPQAYRLLPPACMYYLLGLVKKVSETDDISKVFVDSLPEVKIKSTVPLETKMVFGNVLPISYEWTFMVASKHPLATLTLFNDFNRDFFAVTGALFINMKRQTIDLIDMHPNNKSQNGIQVLNTFIRPDMFLPFNGGWPEWCCYQIEVSFKTMLYIPKVYEQTVVFDFKGDSKIAKKLSITIQEPKVLTQEVTPISVPCINSDGVPFSYAQISNDSLSRPKSVEPQSESIESESDDENNSEGEISANKEVTNINLLVKDPCVNKINNPVFKSISQKSNLVESNSFGVTPISPPPCLMNRQDETHSNTAALLLGQRSNLGLELENKQNVTQSMNKSNYKSWMSLFLRTELKLRQDVLCKISGITEIKLLQPSFPSVIAQLGCDPDEIGLVGEVNLSRDVNRDSKLGRLFINSCQTLSIRKVSGTAIAKPQSHVCRIFNKSNLPITILIGRNAVKELSLKEGSIEKFDIWLFLDQTYLTLITSIILGLKSHHLNILFPDFIESQWDINSIVGSSDDSMLEGKITLNAKQKEAFHSIVVESSQSNNKSAKKSTAILLTGPSVSGKSILISQCVIKLVTLPSSLKKSNRIIICTFSNEAADQYISDIFSSMTKNLAKNDCLIPLRIYSTDHPVGLVSQLVKGHCLFVNDGTTFRYPTLQEIFLRKIIVVTIRTCMELIKLGLREDTFSHIFIDEAERMMEAESVCPISLAGEQTQVIISGDTMIIEPETYSSEVSEHFIHGTLLERLDKLYPIRHPLRLKLEETYGNHKDISQFVSDEFYSSSLKCRSLQSSSNSQQYYPLSFSVVAGGEELQPDHGDGYYNMLEIYEVRDRIMDLVKAWPSAWGSPKEHSIVVLTPYADQALALRVKLKLNGLTFVDVETLPNVLNKHYRVVIVSPVRTFKKDNVTKVSDVREKETECGFFTNKKAIYTAFSRAQFLVLVVGDLTSLCNLSPHRDIWRQYVSLCRRNGSIVGLQNLVSPTTLLPNISPPLMDKTLSLGFNIPASSPSSISSIPNSFVPTTFETVTHNSSLFVKRPILAIPTQKNFEGKHNSQAMGYGEHLSTIWDSIPSVIHSNSITCKVSPPRSEEKRNSPWNTFSVLTSAPNSNLGSLADPKSIWSTMKDSTTTTTTTTNQINNNRYPPGLHLESSRNSEIKVENKMTTTTAYQSSFDLPDVRLMAETASSTKNTAAVALPPKDPLPYPSVTNSHMPINYPCVTYTSDGKPMGYHDGYKHYFYSFENQNNNRRINPVSNIAVAPPSSIPPSIISAGSGLNLSTLNQLPRRQIYVPPPRMLNKAINRPTGTIRNHELSKEFDFFAEMGLLSDIDKDNGGKIPKNSLSSSSSSTTHGSNECIEEVNDQESFNLDSTEFPKLDSSKTEWIEVKSSKRSKSPSTKAKVEEQKGKKGKKKSKVNGQIVKPKEKEITVDQKIESLKEMGFEKRFAIKALQACDKDLQRAVEWLIQNAPLKKD